MSEMILDRGFNLTLEILQGCRYNCAGCLVDKEFSPGPFDVDGPGLLSLADEMEKHGYVLREFTVGPVDVIASRASIEILDQPLIKGLVERYQGMVLPLALIDDTGLKELCEKVNVLLKGKRIKIATPFPIKSVYNEKHISLLRSRVKFIIDHIPDVKFDLLYLTVNMTDDSSERIDVETDQDIHALDFGVRKLVEYVFPHARKGFDDLLNRQAFLRAFKSFCGVIKKNGSRYLIKPLDDSLELSYRAGKLYYTPTLIEKFPIFTDEFVVPSPWTRESVEALEENLYVNELINRVDHPTCGDCSHLNRCARGDVHSIMSHLQYDECLVNMKNEWNVPL